MKRLLLFFLIHVLMIDFSESQQDEYLIKEFKYHTAPVLSVAFAPDSNYLVSGGEDKQIVILNLTTMDVENKFSNNHYSPYCIEVAASKNIYFGSGPDIKLIDFMNNKLALFEGSTTQIWSLDYAPVNRKIVAGSYDYKVKVWDCATQKIDIILEGHKKSTFAAAFSPDERYIITGSLDKTIKVWNTVTGEMTKSLDRHADRIYDVKFHPSGKYFASCSNDKTIKLWDTETGEVLKTYFGHDFGVIDIEFTPDGNHLISASFDGTIRLWQLKSGNTIYTFTSHKGTVNSIAVNGNGSLLASGGIDNKVILWKLDKNIFVQFAFFDEFEAEKNKSGLFLPKQKNEKKEDYESRENNAKNFEDQLVDRYYQKYIEAFSNQTFK